ncbi:hypothetical protein O1611_g4188 [Lasiodiplodia mahajangana]|uniref:Uncharacterized protein n=1 Tax=Lasiodiplodia mahajangana TaxID=1108764 RepID=A0ACC2JQ18_9PEZI|nr:hypothetical protein O1611_g4188 [Lasiodiplodia mahajangana]
MRCTLVSATFSADGQLHQNVISGPSPASSCLSEEGLYILYGKRGLQIASVCDLRKCYITQVCHCTEQQQQQQHLYTDATLATNITGTKRGPMKKFAWELGKRCALSWLNFYEAAETIRSLRLCFLAHPRTLSWDEVFGTDAFHFDSDLEEHYTSTRSYKCRSKAIIEGLKEYSGGSLIDCIGDAWKDFLECGGYDFRPVVTLPEQAWGEEEDTEDDDDCAGDADLDISEWDDTDSPIHSHDPSATPLGLGYSRKRPRPEDDFDLIDDLIEEEFPRLKRTLQEPLGDKDIREQHSMPQYISPIATRKMNNIADPIVASNNTGNGKDGDHIATMNTPPEEPPAPVIPPKDMFIGRGLTFCAFPTQHGIRRCGDGFGFPRDSRAVADMWVSASC